MILVTSSSKPLQHTPKGTLRRQTILSDYGAEIDALYNSVDDVAQVDESNMINWTEAGVFRFVREVVKNIMGKAVRDNEDIFQYGCDR